MSLTHPRYSQRDAWTRHLVRLASIVALVTASALAQDVAVAGSPPKGDLPPVIKKTLRAVVGAFEGPIHVIVAGVAPAGGLGAGIGVDLPFRGAWSADAKALVSMQRAWLGEIGTHYRSNRTRVDMYGRVRNMPQLAYYGEGIESTLDNRSNFRLRDAVVGTHASVRLAGWVTLGVRVEENWTIAGPGASTTFPSIETRFGAGDVPGMTGKGKYGRYQASLGVRVPSGVGESFHQGAQYRITYAHFDDHLTNQFTFARLDVEAQQTFAMPITQHRLTLHGWVSSTQTDAGQDVPFHLERTLGGKSFVRSVADDIIGSDGSDATLRAFGALRFRDRNLLLLQAEYRVPIWGLFEATAYVDAGKVVHDRSELGVSDLKHNFGFSVSAMKAARTVARADIAFGGGEGYRLFFTVGRNMN